MIEPTEEMRRAYEKAAAEEWGWITARSSAAGLAAVLAIVERDYRIEPRPPWDHCTCQPPYGSSDAPDPACPVHHRRAARRGAS